MYWNLYRRKWQGGNIYSRIGWFKAWSTRSDVSCQRHLFIEKRLTCWQFNISNRIELHFHSIRLTSIFLYLWWKMIREYQEVVREKVLPWYYKKSPIVLYILYIGCHTTGLLSIQVDKYKKVKLYVFPVGFTRSY